MNPLEQNDYPEISAYMRFVKHVQKEMTDIFLDDFVKLATNGIGKVANRMKDFAKKKRKGKATRGKKITKAQKKQKEMNKKKVDAYFAHKEAMTEMKGNIK